MVPPPPRQRLNHRPLSGRASAEPPCGPGGCGGPPPLHGSGADPLPASPFGDPAPGELSAAGAFGCCARLAGATDTKGVAAAGSRPPRGSTFCCSSSSMSGPSFTAVGSWDWTRMSISLPQASTPVSGGSSCPITAWRWCPSLSTSAAYFRSGVHGPELPDHGCFPWLPSIHYVNDATQRFAA